MKTVRGWETRTKAKLEKEGWELVSQTQGALRSELRFRRLKPKTPWKLIGIGGGTIALLIILLLIINAITGGESATEDASSSPTRSQATATERPAEASTASAEPVPAETRPAASVTDITVDELLDKLNSAGMGGLTVGDQLRVNGELFMSDLWMTGASGDFVVSLKAQGGAQDLPVFADKSDAASWHDGTKVEMVLEMVETTINGETTDGWLRATSVRVIP